MRETPDLDLMTIIEIPMTEMAGRGSSMTGMMTETDTEIMTDVMTDTENMTGGMRGIENMRDSPEIEENMIEGTVTSMIEERGMKEEDMIGILEEMTTTESKRKPRSLTKLPRSPLSEERRVDLRRQPREQTPSGTPSGRECSWMRT